MLAPILSALKTGKTVVIDEITTTLHTKLSEEIIKLFASPNTNTNNAQFIFSTHDTNLLSSSAMRRDEIWFAEKNSQGKTSIYPLSDFQTRKSDNLERGYLQGRFGAIPFFGDFSDFSFTN
jgi:AAA15 family ATPase/GTPase